MIFFVAFLIMVIDSFISKAEYTDIPCQWKSLTGSNFDLRALRKLNEKDECYSIKDGDIPCTPEIEPTYSYVWNFCGDVTNASFPSVCNPTQMGAVFQYIHRESDGYEECNIIGHYDPLRDDTYYNLLDPNDPSKGVSLTYKFGDRCPSGQLRTATIDVECANTKSTILSAQEPLTCQYHLTMQSYYGCPTECPVTSNGLCNSHGHCRYDPYVKAPHCYCNKGYGGSSCTPMDSSSNTSYNGLSVQLWLMAILLILAVVFVGIIAYLAYNVSKFREQQYSSLSSHSMHGRGGESELTIM